MGDRLDASGWSNNLLLAPEVNDTLAYRDGGRISLRSGGDLSLGQGSLLDVSSGAAMLADGKRLGGRGGDIALHASAGPALAGDGQLQLGGTLSGLGVSGAGTLSLQSGKVRIGGDDLGDGSLQLAEDFFQQGFANYRVVGRSGLTIAEDAQVRVTRPVYRVAAGAGEVAAGEAPREALEAWTPPLYLEDVLAGRLIQREGADLYLQAGGDGNILEQLDPASQTLELGHGSLVEVDPGRAIVLRGSGQITLDGTLNAWGGRIDVRQQQFGQIDVAESFQSAQAQAHARSIWIGEQAVLDVAGALRRRSTGADGLMERCSPAAALSSAVRSTRPGRPQPRRMPLSSFAPARAWRPLAARRCWMYPAREGSWWLVTVDALPSVPITDCSSMVRCALQLAVMGRRAAAWNWRWSRRCIASASCRALECWRGANCRWRNRWRSRWAASYRRGRRILRCAMARGGWRSNRSRREVSIDCPC
ncbi:hypothetical protein NFX37_13240 [Serratia marcescens]|nr:hypothetical protein NFX37_13240 [Serratia marcescens]